MPCRRRVPDGRAVETLERLARLKIQVRILQADVAREEEVSAALSDIAGSMPPIKGVFHLAGSLDDVLLTGQDLKRFRTGGLAKVEGA